MSTFQKKKKQCLALVEATSFIFQHSLSSFDPLANHSKSMQNKNIPTKHFYPAGKRVLIFGVVQY